MARVNGTPAQEVAQFTALLDAAKGWVAISIADGLDPRLDADSCRNAHQEIMTTCGIPKKKEP